MLTYSKIGNQYQVPMKVGTAQRWALVYLPDDFFTEPNKKYPLLIFQHGNGEVGSGADGLSKLFAWGPPKLIKEGSKMQFVNPTSGILEKFIVVSPQLPAAGFLTAGFFEAIVKGLGIYDGRVKAAFATGLSQGARSVLNLVIDSEEQSNYGHLFTAIAALSPFMWDREMVSIKNVSEGTALTSEKAKASGIKVYLTGGTLEELRFKNAIKNVPLMLPGQTIVTTFERGHTGWNTEYSENYKDPKLGGLSLYQWFLSLMPKEPVKPTNPPPVIEEPKPEPEQPTNPVIKLVRLKTESSYEDRRILTYKWKQVSGPPAIITNGTSQEVSITGLVPGNYVFAATLLNDRGRQITHEYPFEVSGNTNNPYKVKGYKEGTPIIIDVEGPAITGSVVMDLGAVKINYKTV